ncbi:MAG: hypothetical protein AAF968_17485, partial [Pseudomonadota bacterium]
AAEEQGDAEVLAALEAANASIEAVDKANDGPAQTKPTVSTPSRPTATAPTRGDQLSRGEKEGLSISLREYFRYPGRRDPDLVVVIKASFNPDGSFRGAPTEVSASGGDKATQGALSRAAQTALRRAQALGVFAKLGPKLSTWKSVEFRFTPDERVRLSS